MAISRLVTLSISSHRNLDIEANKFYDRAHRLYDAALLTRFTLNMLFCHIETPKMNHIRHFFQNLICQQGD